MTHSRSTERGEWRAPPSPIQVLVAAGWLDAALVGDPGIRVETLSRSHVVSRVTAPDGRAAVVKHTTQASAESGRDLCRELFVYRLSRSFPSLATVLVQPLLMDERRQILVLEALPNGSSWPNHDDGSPIATPNVCEALGRAMANWHRETLDLTLWGSLTEGVFHLPDTVGSAVEGRSPSAQRLLRELAGDAELSAALRLARTQYKHRCLIHGDIRSDNWILDRRTTPPVLKILDWEMSGSGDPAWDVGSVLAESMIDALRGGAGERPDDPWLRAALETIAPRFLGAYRAADGVVGLGDVAEVDRVVSHTFARLLHVASEWAEYPINVETGLVADVTRVARLLLRRRADVAAAIREWAST